MSDYTPLNITYSVAWNTLCSGALLSLGREGLADYTTDDSVDAGLCRTFLPEAISVASSYFDWTFLRTFKTLSYDTTVTTGPYIYAYSIPLDSVRLTRVTTEGDVPFKIIGRTIWTDSRTCSVMYQALPYSPDVLPMPFLKAIEHYLAFLLARPLSGNDSLKQNELTLFQYWVEQAVNADRAWLYEKGETWWTELIDG